MVGDPIPCHRRLTKVPQAQCWLPQLALPIQALTMMNYYCDKIISRRVQLARKSIACITPLVDSETPAFAGLLFRATRAYDLGRGCGLT